MEIAVETWAPKKEEIWPTKIAFVKVEVLEATSSVSRKMTNYG